MKKSIVKISILTSSIFNLQATEPILSPDNTIGYAYMKDGEKLIKVLPYEEKHDSDVELIKITKRGFYPNYQLTREQIQGKLISCMVAKSDNKSHNFYEKDISEMCDSYYTVRTKRDVLWGTFQNLVYTATTFGTNLATGFIVDNQTFDEKYFLKVVKDNNLDQYRAELEAYHANKKTDNVNRLNNPKPAQAQPTRPQSTTKISFVNPPLAVDSSSTHIKVKISGESYGEELLINGIEITSLGTKEENDGNTTYKIYNLPLQNGLNNITVSAYDKTHTAKVDTITHTIVAKYVQKKPTLYAVIMGVNEFADSRLNLRFAKNDAMLVKELLEKHAKNIFNGVNVELLTLPQITTKEYAIKTLQKYTNISPNDFFIFYSSTHGAILDNNYYMITSNINKVTPEAIKSETLSQQEIKTLLSKIPTANKLLLFDTCYAGATNESIASELAKLSMGKLNLTSMSAATSSQEALEGNKAQHGLFTYVLADALDGAADFNGDGVIQSMELVNFVNSHLPNEAKKYGRIQTPASFQAGQVFNVVKKDEINAARVNMQPMYYTPQEVNNLVNAMNNNDVATYNNIQKDKEQQTRVKIQQLLFESVNREAENASATFAQDGQKFEIDRYKFIFNDDSVFLNIKDKLKAASAYTDEHGNNLIVFDFYSSQFTPHRVNYIDTPKIPKIDIGWHDRSYRITLHTKTKQSYSYIQNESGIFIKLKNKE